MVRIALLVAALFAVPTLCMAESSPILPEEVFDVVEPPPESGLVAEAQEDAAGPSFEMPVPVKPAPEGGEPPPLLYRDPPEDGGCATGSRPVGGGWLVVALFGLLAVRRLQN